MARKITWKGFEIDRLKAMPLEEFIKLTTSKERRTLKRMSLKFKKFIEKFRKAKLKKKIVKTHLREMVIIPEMLETKIAVHNGKTFQEIFITPKMLGHRLGEFAITTKLVKHSAAGVGATRGSKAIELK